MHAQVVQRRSLRSIMPDAKAVFGNFFKQLDIEEPAFKNVVVLYRRKVADKPQRKSRVRAHPRAQRGESLSMSHPQIVNSHKGL